MSPCRQLRPSTLEMEAILPAPKAFTGAAKKARASVMQRRKRKVLLAMLQRKGKREEKKRVSLRWGQMGNVAALIQDGEDADADADVAVHAVRPCVPEGAIFCLLPAVSLFRVRGLGFWEETVRIRQRRCTRARRALVVSGQMGDYDYCVLQNDVAACLVSGGRSWLRRRVGGRGEEGGGRGGDCVAGSSWQ